MLCGPEVMMRFTARALSIWGWIREGILVSLERNMQCGVGWCVTANWDRSSFVVTVGVPYAGLVSQLLTQRTMSDATVPIPRHLGGVEFASCDGCQLSCSTAKTSS